MRDYTLFAKQSKCVFGTTTVEYLGHIISTQGVATDPNKIKAMKSWPIPSNIKQLRGFLGLIGYYRRFIKDYACISQPLTVLLKKNAFSWNNEAQVAFENLQQAMSQALVLALPNFQEEFIIETDASGFGIGAVLQQKGHAIAFLSKTLAFRTDHFRLKQGKLLSILTALPSNEFMNAITTMWTTDPVLSGIIKSLQDGSLVTTKYTWQGDQLNRKGKWVVGPDEQLRKRKGMRKMVKEVVKTCDVCQGNKSDLSAYRGLLQPLPIPSNLAGYFNGLCGFITYVSRKKH
ncbi:putative mitochondrial protein [Tanacetum coccineum]|uniref:Mitochondrial protein n=1 Tax=Tanacetum coccineum TaxID=301880 RepID=A0ABQ5GR53_9ASTR